jgi:hypothetical protein
MQPVRKISFLGQWSALILSGSEAPDVGGKWKEVYDARRRGESSGRDLMEEVMTGPNEKVAFSERDMRKT